MRKKSIMKIGRKKIPKKNGVAYKVLRTSWKFLMLKISKWWVFLLLLPQKFDQSRSFRPCDNTPTPFKLLGRRWECYFSSWNIGVQTPAEPAFGTKYLVSPAFGRSNRIGSPWSGGNWHHCERFGSALGRSWRFYVRIFLYLLSGHVTVSEYRSFC